jgi:NADH:ubiquinone oxidoreductase subunit 6 (subunit J)
MVLVLFAVIAFAVAETVPWYRPVGGGEDAQGVADALFTRYVVAFEVLGILLTAALLGAMYLAFREATP